MKSSIKKIIYYFVIIFIFFGINWSGYFGASKGLGTFRDNVNIIETGLDVDDVEDDIFNSRKLFNVSVIILYEEYSDRAFIFFQFLSVLSLFIQIINKKVKYRSLCFILSPYVVTSYLGNLRNGLASTIYFLSQKYLSRNGHIIFSFIAIWLHSAVTLYAIVDCIPKYLIKNMLGKSLTQRILGVTLIIFMAFLICQYFVSQTGFDEGSSNINSANSKFIIISPWLIYLWLVISNCLHLDDEDATNVVRVSVFIGLSFILAGYYRYFSFAILILSQSIFKLSWSKQFFFLVYYLCFSCFSFWLWYR